MKAESAFARLGLWAERESLLPDLRRATRATAAFMAPLLAAHFGWLAGPVVFAAMAAQNIAQVDVRGAYRVRVSVLLAMTLVLAGATWLGATAASPLVAAMAATALLAASLGLWRHLSPDYGPSLAASSALLFLIALALPDGSPTTMALFSLGGGLWGVLLQASLWPFRPQHPLRQTAAETWQALGDLFTAMAYDERDPSLRHREIADREAAVRTTLDRTTALLGTGPASRLRTQLDALNLTAARVATRVVVFQAALDAHHERPEYPRLTPAVQPLLTSLANTARVVALALVSRQGSRLATAEVRLRRLGNLVQVVQARLAGHASALPGSGELVDLLRQLAEQLPVVRRQLEATREGGPEHRAFSLELPELEALTFRPLAAVLHLQGRVDPTLVRFTARLAVLLVLGVALFQLGHIHHGYWLPLTVVVVLQPDYGSTRLRAAQRLLGTLLGGLLASALLFLHLPPAVLLAAIAATIFGFSYHLRRNYAVAVLCITVMIVLLTEATTAVTVRFTVERLVATLGGGTLAMLAALIFWPVWERERFPVFLAAALRANRDYLGLLQARLANGGTYDQAVIAGKRRAETANGVLFASLQRMNADPEHQQRRLEEAAALANGNQRLTRALTTIGLHLSGSPVTEPAAAEFAALAGDALETLARQAGGDATATVRLSELRTAIGAFDAPVAAGTGRDQWVFGQMNRAAVELGAMLLAAEDAAQP